MERRLIDANALPYTVVYIVKTGSVTQTSAVFSAEIAKAPTIDAVEVVRCRECKHFREYSEEYKATVENADGDCAIRKWHSDDGQFCAVTKDDYCSLGERREPDGE